jgi:hypothetical protein
VVEVLDGGGSEGANEAVGVAGDFTATSRGIGRQDQLQPFAQQ